jgi:hypothetical protein
MQCANQNQEQLYYIEHNRELAVASTSQGTAYMEFISGSLSDVFSGQHDEKVDNDNSVSFEGLVLQIPADEFRYH